MTRNMKRRQRARAVIYYLSIIVSLGLIWGGGMSLLRGGIVEGIIAISLGILLQLGLKRFRIGERATSPTPDERGAIAGETVYDAHETDATASIEGSDETSKQEQQQVFQRQAARGTDGATLMIDSRSELDIRHKNIKRES